MGKGAERTEKVEKSEQGSKPIPDADLTSKENSGIVKMAQSRASESSTSELPNLEIITSPATASGIHGHNPLHHC